MRKAIYAGILILAATVTTLAQGPTPAPKAPVAPTLPAIDAASETVILPLVKQRDALIAQILPLMKQLNGPTGVMAQLRIAEAKALVVANLDPGTTGVDNTGTKFVPRQGAPQR
jgi:hypothetical protein